jgi:hypothetical protein
MSNLNLIETFVNQFLVVNLRLRGKHSWLFHKMMKSLKHSFMLYLVLKQENGLKLWEKKWSRWKLIKSETWLIYCQDEDPLEINGFLKLNIRQMNQYNIIRLN